MASLQGELADFVVQEYNSNPAFVEGLLTQGEGALQAFVVGVLKSIKVSGLAAIILPYLENGVETFAAALIAKYPPAALYALIGAQLAAEAKVLGG